MRHAVVTVRSERGKVGRGAKTMEAMCQKIQNIGGGAKRLRRVLVHRLPENKGQQLIEALPVAPRMPLINSSPIYRRRQRKRCKQK